MIEALSLRNFKGHRQLDVEFPSGLTLISGTNYSGKTTILHGILFGLFGVGAVPGGAKRVTTRGTSPSSTSASLRFFHGGEVYSIERKISSAKLYRGEKLIATSVSAVGKELEKILGMPTRFFSHLKYAAQGETQALLTLGAAELHKVLELVAGVGLVNRVIDKAAAIASEATVALSVLGEPPDTTKLKSELVEAQRSHSSMQMQLGQLRAQGEQFSTEAAAAGKRLDEAEQSNRRIRESEGLVAGLQEQLAQAQARLDEEQAAVDKVRTELGQAEPAIKAYEELKSRAQRISEVETYLNAAIAQQQAYKEQVGQAQADLKLTPGLSAIPQERVDWARESLVEVKAKLSRLNAEYQKLSAAKQNAVCPACNRPYDTANDLAQLDDRLEAVADEYDVAEALLKEATAELECALQEQAAYREAEKASEDAEARLRQAKDGLTETAFAIGNAEAELESLLLAGEVTQFSLEVARRAAERAQQAFGYHEALTKALARTLKQAQVLDRQLAEALDNSPPGVLVDLDPLRAEVHELRNQVVTARQLVLETTGELRVKEEHLSHLQERLNEAESLAAKIAEHGERKASSSALIKYLRTNRDRFMAELWEQVTNYASGFAATCTGGAISRVGRTAEGAFTFVEDGYEDEVVTASGAQRSIMSLGIQLALDTLLPDTLGALLLDEPTADADPAHATALTQALANSGRQVIMVSHRELDASVAQAHISLA